MIYDPLLEVKLSSAKPETWPASWVWYPGQLGAHLNPLVFQKTIRRCTHIGYPGNFRTPEYRLWLRTRIELQAPTPVRWATPAGRARVRINGREGDITVRSAVLPAGLVEILVQVDLTTSLPCFLLSGASSVSDRGIATGPDWQASLDGEHWRPAEYIPGPASPQRLPDLDQDISIPIQPRCIVRLRNGKLNNGYQLEKSGELLLDFWHDELGEIELDVVGETELAVTVGESLLEADESDPQLGEQYPLLPLKVTHSGVYRLPERCARYVRIQSSAPCQINNVTFHARVYPVEYRGNFECSDERLNEIWRAGAATLHSNIHDGAILDGLKRDALIWLFDQNIGFDGSDCVFADRQVVRNTLLSKSLPENPKRSDIGILDNVCYFIFGFYQDYQVSGDADFIRLHQDRLTDNLDLLESLQNERGLIAARNFSPHAASAKEYDPVEGVDYLGGFFPDWSGKSDIGQPCPTDLDTAGAPVYAQMLLLRCFEIGAEFARLWGDDSCANHYATKARQMRQIIPDLFWDAGRGAFINGLDRHGERDERLSPFAQAWGILCDLVPAGDVAHLVSAIMLDPQQRAANLSMSVYWEYLAFLKTDRFDLALNALRRYWGSMLDHGLTRFIEDIRPEDDERASLVFYGRPYGLSLNHGWTGATPVSILMRGALGLEIIEPGYQMVKIRPNWRTFEWVRCSFPTPYGLLSLDYDQTRGARLHIPSGVQVRLVDGGISQIYSEGDHLLR